ncbi:hypothetical protein D3C77_386490 [compost metagenome]
MFLGQAAVMRSHGRRAQAFAQVAGQAFGQAPGVDEYQRGAVLPGQRGQAVIHQLPDIVGHDGAQGHRRYLQGQVAGTRVADIDNRTVAAFAHQKVGHSLHGALGRRQANTAQGSSA